MFDPVPTFRESLNQLRRETGDLPHRPQTITTRTAFGELDAEPAAEFVLDPRPRQVPEARAGSPVPEVPTAKVTDGVAEGSGDDQRVIDLPTHMNWPAYRLIAACRNDRRATDPGRPSTWRADAARVLDWRQV